MAANAAPNQAGIVANAAPNVAAAAAANNYNHYNILGDNVIEDLRNPQTALSILDEMSQWVTTAAAPHNGASLEMPHLNQTGGRVMIFTGQRGMEIYTRMLLVLNQARENLQGGNPQGGGGATLDMVDEMTQRDFYYDNEYHEFYNEDGLYTEQKTSDGDIVRLANLVNLPRVALGFISSRPQGSVFGAFRVTLEQPGFGQLVFDMGVPFLDRCGYPITDCWIRLSFNMVAITLAATNAVAGVQLMWIIAIEDMGTYLKVKRFALVRGWIVVYMGGQPDVSTCALLHHLQLLLNLPIGVMVDMDKGGIKILRSLMFAGETRANAEQRFAMPYIRWIGILPQHCGANALNLPGLTVPQLAEMNLGADDRVWIRQNTLDRQDFFPNAGGAHWASRRNHQRRQQLEDWLARPMGRVNTAALNAVPNNRFGDVVQHMLEHWV
ncbi:hypothetical protein ACHAXT_009655 [Thalassiosira profunda]